MVVTELDDHRRARADRQPGRIPPNNLDAERSLLGAMLLTRDAIEASLDADLRPDDFYKPAHGHIYDAVTTLHGAGEPADPVTVVDHFDRHGVLEQLGGRDDCARLLLDLRQHTPATSNAGRYARIVHDHAIVRRLIAAAGDIAEDGYSLPDDIDATLDQAEQRIYDIADRRRHNADVVTLADAFADHLDVLEARYEGRLPLGAPTGLHALDDLIGGLAPGQLVTVAARPGMGKTSTGIGMAFGAARAGNPALFVSIEMSTLELLDRTVAALGHVDLARIRQGTTLAEKDWARISLAASKAGDLPVEILDDPGATIASIRSAVRRRARHGLKVVVVDYLQIIHVAHQTGDRRVDVDAIARGLKRMARDLKVAVVALCQLNRSVEARADKRPMLSDLRESGQIEQESDVVIGLYRDEMYHPDSKDAGVMELIVLKQRNGPTGTARVAFLNRYQDLQNMAKT